MVPKKKRWRYRVSAMRLAQENGVALNPDDWNAIWQILDTHGQPEFLYAIGDPTNRMVKFGRSRDPSTRLRAMRTGNGVELYLWGYCPHRHPFTEKEVHMRLKAHRVIGEWFRLTPEVQAVVDEVRTARA